MPQAPSLPTPAPAQTPPPPWIRQRTQAKARVLVEALPYVREHAGRIVLIKLGGSAMAGELLDRFAQDVALLCLAGVRPIVMHGGSPHVTEALNSRGVRTIGVSEDDSHVLISDYRLDPNREGRPSTIDADSIAAEVAVAAGATKLLVLTDAAGVMQEGELISELSVGEAEGLLEGGEVTGGMVPKLEAVVRAVRGGVGRAHVIDGRIEHALVLELFTPEGIGTMIGPDEEADA